MFPVTLSSPPSSSPSSPPLPQPAVPSPTPPTSYPPSPTRASPFAPIPTHPKPSFAFDMSGSVCARDGRSRTAESVEASATTPGDDRWTDPRQDSSVSDTTVYRSSHGRPRPLELGSPIPDDVIARVADCHVCRFGSDVWVLHSRPHHLVLVPHPADDGSSLNTAPESLLFRFRPPGKGARPRPCRRSAGWRTRSHARATPVLRLGSTGLARTSRRRWTTRS